MTIVRVALQIKGKDVMTFSQCPHGLTESTCSFCKAVTSRVVYFSAGGDKYHFDVNCRTFLEGRKKVRDEGGVNSPIETGREHTAKFERSVCQNCRHSA